VPKPSTPAFLEKLYDILTDVSNNPYIAWQADGTAFLIKKVPELQEIVLPKYFKHNNLQSFVRQLNMYNFAKTCHDPNYREFRNAFFLRGRRDLLPQIRRKAQGSARDQPQLGALSASVPSSSSGGGGYRPIPSSGGSSSSSSASANAANNSIGITMDVDTYSLDRSFEEPPPTAGSSSFTGGQRSSSRKRTSTFKALQGGSGFLASQDLRAAPNLPSQHGLRSRQEPGLGPMDVRVSLRPLWSPLYPHACLCLRLSLCLAMSNPLSVPHPTLLHHRTAPWGLDSTPQVARKRTTWPTTIL
jgi:heat shock transcription factor